MSKKNEGKIFEQCWKESVPKDIFYLRIKDTASSFGKSESYIRFTLPNPCDCLIFYKGILMPMELKSTKSKSFSVQKSNDSSSRMIKFKQTQSLFNMSKYKDVIPGYIFDFRESNTYWLNISDFMEFLNNTNKCSINETDIITHNGIKIDKQLRKTKYSYNIESLLNSITKEVTNIGQNNFL